MHTKHSASKEETVILRVWSGAHQLASLTSFFLVSAAPLDQFLVAAEKADTPHLSPYHQTPCLKTTTVVSTKDHHITVLKDHTSGWHFKVYGSLKKTVTPE